MKKYIIPLLLLTPSVSFGQDFGPHTFSLVPKDITSVNFYYINSHNSITPSKDIVLKSGIVNVDALVMPIVHSFSLDGHLSQVFITPGVGSLHGFSNINGKHYDIVDVDGSIDSTVMLRVGLLNTPALSVEDFANYQFKFQLSGIASISIPTGQYSQSRRVNLGANRWAFKLGAPMIIPLNKKKGKIFQWEIVPSVTFFTDNTQPFSGNTKTQEPLFWLEQHFSKNFTPRLWASINIDYQYGGQVYVDGSRSGKVIDTLGAGVSMSYAPFTSLPVNLHASYSKTWFNGMSGYLYQLGASFAIP